MSQRDQEQANARNLIRNSFARGDNVALCVAATGYGKSHVIKYIASTVKGHLLVITPRVALVDDLSNRVKDSSIYCATLNQKNLSRVTIATKQSIEKIDISGFDLIILDEAHNYRDSFLEKIKNKRVIGFTATPWTEKGLIYPDFFKEPCYEFGIEKSIACGFLCDYKIFGTENEFNTKKYENIKRDYTQKEVNEIVADAKIEKQVNEILAAADKYNRKKVAILCASIDHAERVNDLLPDSVVVHSKLKKPQDAITEFRNERRFSCSVMMLSEGFDCLDRDTEILTPNGWVGMDGIGGETHCYSINMDGESEIVDIQRVIKKQHTGKMVNIKSQSLNIRVTENHNIFYKKKKMVGGKMDFYDFEKTKAGDFWKKKGILGIPIAASCSVKKNNTLTDDHVRLLGFFFGDGCFSGKKLAFYQSKPSGVKWLKDILQRSGLDYTVSIRKKELIKSTYNSNYDLYVFHIPKGTHKGLMKRNGWNNIYSTESLNKNPEILHTFSKKQILLFHEGFAAANGSSFFDNSEKLKNKNKTVWTSNKSLYDTMSHVCVINGIYFKGASITLESGVVMYNYRINHKKPHNLHQIAWYDSRSARFEFEYTENEEVWCVTNRNGTIITRRNGSCVVLGNCPAVDMVVFLRPTKSSRLMVQACGRGLRLSDGKDFCLLMDFGNVFENCGTPRKPIIPEKGKTIKQLKDELQLKRCEKCFCVFEQKEKECPECGHVNSTRDLAASLNSTAMKETKRVLITKANIHIKPGMNQPIGRTKFGAPYLCLKLPIIKFTTVYGKDAYKLLNQLNRGPVELLFCRHEWKDGKLGWKPVVQ